MWGFFGGRSGGRALEFLRRMHGFVAEVEVEVVHGKGQGYYRDGGFGVFSYRAVSVGAEWCMDGGYGLRVVDVGR